MWFNSIQFIYWRNRTDVSWTYVVRVPWTRYTVQPYGTPSDKCCVHSQDPNKTWTLENFALQHVPSDGTETQNVFVFAWMNEWNTYDLEMFFFFVFRMGNRVTMLDYSVCETNCSDSVELKRLVEILSSIIPSTDPNVPKNPSQTKCEWLTNNNVVCDGNG